MREIKGKAPRVSDKRQTGNADCVLAQFAENLIPVVEESIHAVKCYDRIESADNLARDTIYVDCHGTINVIVMDQFNVNIPEDLPTMPDGLFEHLSRPIEETELYFMSNMTVRTGSSGLPAKVAKINNHVVGYYLPDLNSWVTTNWTWHIQYMTVVLAYAWPKFIEGFGISLGNNSLASEKKGEKVKKIEVTIGCDPEFETLKNGKVVRADTIINRDNAVTPTAEIGLDGQRAQVEVRPKPSSNPGKVVKNIRDLMKKFAKDYSSVDLTDKGNNYPLGGHIHVGIGQRIEVDRELGMILDDFIGRPTINLSGSAREGYKRLASQSSEAIRSQPHGFEYRSTPAAVFQNPRIAYIVFKLAKNLSEKYFNQETIKYEERPTIQNYIDVGGLTEKQATYFMKFIEDYKPEVSLRSAWKVEAAPVDLTFQNNITVEFHDEWDPIVSRALQESIQDAVMSNRPVVVSFYGLNEDRGTDICTLPCSGFNTMFDNIPKPYMSSGNVLNIGVSRNRRMDMGSARVRTLTDTVRNAVTNLMGE